MGRRSRLLTACAAVAGLLAAGLALPPAARAAEPGIVSDLNWGISSADQDRTASLIQSMGARWTRIHVAWRDFEQSKGSYNNWNLAATGDAIAKARAAGANVVLMVYDAPAWASGSTSSNVPKNPADFGNFMGFLSGYYRGQVAAYEIWNEENIARFWSTGPNPSAYAALLRVAYPAVKSGDPDALVVFGGLSTNDYPFVEGAYQAGAKGFFDVMATHPYTYCGTAAPERIARRSDDRMTRDSFPAYREIRASMLAQGDDKPIWFTEFGWNTSTKVCDPSAGVWMGGVSEATQADYLSRALHFVEADPYVQVALWYNFRNNFWALDADRPEARFGLLRTDFSPKPAFSAFSDYAASIGTPPPAGAPLVAITSPPDGARFRNTLAMSAEATDDVEVVSVEFRLDGQFLANLTSQPYSFVWDVPSDLAWGQHTLEARATDSDGLVAVDAVQVNRSRRKTRTRLSSRTAPAARGFWSYDGRTPRLVGGLVRGGPESGRVRVSVQRYEGERWRRASWYTARFGATGRYSRVLYLRRGSLFRVRAYYRGSQDFAPSTSRRVYIRTA